MDRKNIDKETHMIVIQTFDEKEVINYLVNDWLLLGTSKYNDKVLYTLGYVL